MNKSTQTSEISPERIKEMKQIWSKKLNALRKEMDIADKNQISELAKKMTQFNTLRLESTKVCLSPEMVEDLRHFTNGTFPLEWEMRRMIILKQALGNERRKIFDEDTELAKIGKNEFSARTNNWITIGVNNLILHEVKKRIKALNAELVALLLKNEVLANENS